MRITINENLLQDYLYENVKDIPEFTTLGMDQQGEIIVKLVSEVDRVMADIFKPIELSI